MTVDEAYRKGWDASKRTTTYDLEAAEDRFLARYGAEFHDDSLRDGPTTQPTTNTDSMVMR